MEKARPNGIRKAFLHTVFIILIVILLLGGIFKGIAWFNPNSIVKKLPYDFIKQHILYDHIVYDGFDYYMTDTDIPDHIGKDKFIVEQDCVVLVDADGVPYEEGRTEDAWIFVNDPDAMYLQFNSATYTRNKEFALPCYDFQN